MNEIIIQNLKAIIVLENIKPKPNSFRIRTYNKTIKVLSVLNYEITEASQLDGIRGIGPKTKEKIDEILKSGTLKKLEGFKMPSSDNVDSSIIQLKNLQKITGIGKVKANKLLKDGHTLETLTDLYKSDPTGLKQLVTNHQFLGIKYFDDLENRIPYNEITKIKKYLQVRLDWINTHHYSKDEFKLEICGSYRRKQETSGDIDVLFYNSKNNLEHPKFIDLLIKRLTNLGFLRDDLTSSKGDTTKYMGFCKLPGAKYCRRIDIRCIKQESFGPAMLYFTGSGDFNVNMRSYARKKGIKINEYGVFKVEEDGLESRINSISTEADIFEYLGQPYINPEDRLPTVQFK